MALAYENAVDYAKSFHGKCNSVSQSIRQKLEKIYFERADLLLQEKNVEKAREGIELFKKLRYKTISKIFVLLN